MSKFSLQSDNGLFERCFRDNYQALCFYASGILKDDVASEDVVQEVFVRLLNMNKDFDSYNHLKHYLYVAVHNLCIDRSKASLRYVSLDGTSAVSQSDNNQQQEHNRIDAEIQQDNVEIGIIRAECIRMIAAAIEELSEGQRTVFKLAYMEDKSNEEIAAIMGISVNTVKVHKQRAKDNLRKKLNDIYPLLFILIKYIQLTS